MQPSTADRFQRAKRAAARTAVIVLMIINVLAVLPGVVFSVLTDSYMPTLTLTGISLLAWAAGFGIVRLVRAHRSAATTKREDHV